MDRLEQIRVEIEVLKDEYWKYVNVHRPTPSVFKKRELLDDRITQLEIQEAELETIEFNR